MISFVSLLLLCSSIYGNGNGTGNGNENGKYSLSNNTAVEFINTYFSRYQSLIPGYEFETAQDPQYILNETINDTQLCMNECAYNIHCRGIYEYTGIDNTTIYCNELSNLGHDPILSNNYSNSYTKFQVYDYISTNYTIDGYVLNLYDELLVTPYNYTVYLDINHNGLWEDWEPSNITINGYFMFNNMTSGTYLVRTIPEDGCYITYPGLDGSYNYNYNNYNLGDTYADNVINYYNHAHYTHYGPHGKLISNSSFHQLNTNFSFILGPNNDTYLQFYPQYGITLDFIDEVVHNNNGSDIFFTLYGESTTYSEVSVSYNNINYTYLGTLNTTQTEFDLEDIQYPIRYISLTFYGDNNTDPLNIVNIYTNPRSELGPAHGYMIIIPHELRDEYSDVFFINDCQYSIGCNFYCNANMYSMQNYYSCLMGCQLFRDINNCDCVNIDDYNITLEYNYGIDDVNTDLCYSGCIYGIKETVHPNYTVFPNLVGKHDQCYAHYGNITLDILVDYCNDNLTCQSMALKPDFHGHLYNATNFDYEPYSNYLVKNEYLDLLSATSTSATTSESTGTSTETSSTATSESTSTATTETTATSESTATSTSGTSSTSESTASSTSGTSSTSESTETSTTTNNINSNSSKVINNSNSSKVINNSNSNSKSSAHLTYIIISLLLLIIFAGIIIGLYILKLRRNNYNIQNRPRFDNPAYNSDNNSDINSDINNPDNQPLYFVPDIPFDEPVNNLNNSIHYSFDNNTYDFADDHENNENNENHENNEYLDISSSC